MSYSSLKTAMFNSNKMQVFNFKFSSSRITKVKRESDKIKCTTYVTQYTQHYIKT